MVACHLSSCTLLFRQSAGTHLADKEETTTPFWPCCNTRESNTLQGREESKISHAEIFSRDSRKPWWGDRKATIVLQATFLHFPCFVIFSFSHFPLVSCFWLYEVERKGNLMFWWQEGQLSRRAGNSVRCCHVGLVCNLQGMPQYVG